MNISGHIILALKSILSRTSIPLWGHETHVLLPQVPVSERITVYLSLLQYLECYRSPSTHWQPMPHRRTWNKRGRTTIWNDLWSLIVRGEIFDLWSLISLEICWNSIESNKESSECHNRDDEYGKECHRYGCISENAGNRVCWKERSYCRCKIRYRSITHRWRWPLEWATHTRSKPWGTEEWEGRVLRGK